MRRHVFSAAVALGLSLACLDAQAGDTATAEALFKAGKEALDRGDYETACARLRESHELDPAPGTAFNLGTCEEARGNVATAWALLEEARQRLPPNDERVVMVKERIVALEPRLPKLTIRLSTAAGGGTVKRGETPIKAGALGQPLPVDPGEHVIRWSREGYAPTEVKVTLAERESREVVVEAGPKLPDATVPSPQPNVHVAEAGDDGFALKVSGGVVGGIGLAGLGAGLAMILVAKQQYDDQASRCPGNVCDRSGFDARNDARTLGDGATVAIACGGAATATGVLLFALGFTQGPPDSEMVRALPIPVVGSGGAGLVWGGTL